MVASTAAVALWVTVASCGLMLFALAGAQLRLISPLVAFGLFAAGLGLGGAMSLALGIIGWFRSGAVEGWLGSRGAAVAIAFGGLCIAFVALQLIRVSGLPTINDITTDTQDPPIFPAELDLYEGGRGGLARYPDGPPAGTRLQSSAYPDLGPIPLSVPVDEAFDRAIAAADQLGWRRVGRSTEEETVFVATAETSVFRFVDDVVVRVRPSSSGSIVDVRSKSRVGVGDLGANARRIRRFRDLLLR